MSTSSNLDAARRYARRAWRIFPLPYPRADGSCSCGRAHDAKDVGKHPLLADWPNLATYDEARVTTWWTEEPAANIGLVTGSLSGIFVLDVDGEAGELSLAKLEALYEKLPDTYQVETGRGRHLYFSYPEGQRINNSAGLLGPNLDVRGENGYVVAPPSRHGSGKVYVVSAAHPTLPAAPPAWLIEKLTGQEAKRSRAPHVLEAKIAHGHRNQAMASAAGKLRYYGLGYNELLAALKAINQERCAPPLDERELETVARSIATKDPGRFSITGLEDADELRLNATDAMRPVTWRWPGFLPLNALVLWAGDPGLGKSTVAYDLAARVTLGGAMPFAEGDGERHAPANVLILSGEDDAERIVNPRLTVAGADHKYKKLVHPLTRQGKPVSLPEHVPHLRRLMEELKPKLVIIDPLNAFVGVSVDSHKDAEMRYNVTQPLSALADEHDATVLAIAHLNKSATASAFYRVGGSIALVGAPRAVFLFGDDEEDENLHAFMCLKNNYARKPKALLYTIEQRVLGGVGPTSYIKWQRESQEHSPEAVIEKGPRADARAFLKEALAQGPRPALEIKKEAAKQGISIRTIERARKDLNLQSLRRENQWYMALADYDKREFTQGSLLPPEEL